MKQYMNVADIKFSQDIFDLTINISLNKSKLSPVLTTDDNIETYTFFASDNKPKTLIELASSIAQFIKDDKMEFNLKIDSEINSEFLLENIILVLTDVNVLKHTYKQPSSYTVNCDSTIQTKFEQAIAKASGYHLARMLNHLPYELCNSQTLSENINSLLDDSRFKIEIYRQKECEEMEINGVLALSKGAHHEPAVIKIEYKTCNAPKIGLVGKGIMFDCGGYNIKGGDFSSMKTDMAGAGAVIGTLKTIANLNYDANVVAYLMTAENLINEVAMLPGHVITYSNDLSVEVVNTDAEGRLVLADGLLLSEKDNCDVVVDIGTLTGNSAAALGKGLAPIYSKDQEVLEIFTSENLKSTDNVWPMPLYDDYNDFLKGDISDLKNISSTKHAGSIMGAMFLQYFAPENSAWAHIDMGAMSRKIEFGSPVNGFGVRLLTKFIENYSKKKC